MANNNSLPPLDFRAVDGLSFSAERNRSFGNTVFRAAALGPLIELHHLKLHESSGSDGFPVELSIFRPLLEAIDGQRPYWFDEARGLGMARVSTEARSNEWTDFAMRAKRAAMSSGFTSGSAGQLVAAVTELEDNVREHSGAIETGIAVFHAARTTFEVVVLDAGAGVRSTLNNSLNNQTLASDTEALRAALTEGVSRFGTNTGRGFGYRPLFTGLVNRQATLRFRSGKGSLVMDGVSPGLPIAQAGQKANLGGLLVSVRCQIEDQ